MLCLPVRVESAGQARRALDHDLTARGIEGGARDDLLLIVSELVTNAIRHGQPLGSDGTVHVGWTVGDRGVAIEVTDGGEGLPKASASGTEHESGRGLALVDALSTRWGVAHDATPATTVWACVAHPPVG